MAEIGGAPRRVTLGVSLKLYLDVAATARWAEAIAGFVKRHPSLSDGSIRLFVLPSLPALSSAQRAFDGVPVAVGAQDLHWEDRGAFTGGVSGADLREVGCEFVEVAHAERLSVWCEGPEVARAKLRAAIRNDLVPVVCVGEPNQLDPEAAATACIAQLDHLLEGIEEPGELVVAYEPVWAIGASEAASSAHISGVAARIRAHLDDTYGSGAATLIYGGSAQPGTLTSISDAVDGLFLGRFAHDPDSLEEIVCEAERICG